MALTHSIFKKRIPTEIPIQSAVVKPDEKYAPDTQQKLIDAFNQLHIDTVIRVTLIQDILHYDKTRSAILPLSLTQIIINYCSFQEYAQKLEPVRMQGVKLSHNNQVLVVQSDNSYPLIIPHQQDGESVDHVVQGLQRDIFYWGSEQYRLNASYVESDGRHYRGIKDFPAGTIGCNNTSLELYSEGVSIVDSTARIHNNFTTYTRFDKPMTTYSNREKLHFLTIPPGKIADINIDGFSYTIGPPALGKQRVFKSPSAFFDLVKIYDPNASSGFIGSLFCCKRKKVKVITVPEEEKSLRVAI
ncbi:MAG: hypothetical protein ACYCQI_00880 [Gammaproteobacteria bacterium]